MDLGILNDTLDSKRILALKEFSRKHIRNPRVIGLIVTGSSVYSKPHKNSDLDIHIVLKDGKFRERGKTFIHGIEIEYFINPLNQLLNYMETEYQNRQSITAHMISNGIAYYHKPELKPLIAKSRSYMSKEYRKLSKVELDHLKLELDDLEKDLEDVLLEKDIFSFELISSQILQLSERILTLTSRKPLDKPKRLKSAMKNLDPIFTKIFINVVTERDSRKKYRYLKKLCTHTNTLLGGRINPEWKFKSKTRI